jgi:hypothetical protein
MLARLGEEGRDVGRIVLAVGVDLQQVAVAQARGFAHARHHRPALAAVLRQAQQRNLAREVPRRARSSTAAHCGIGAVVDQQQCTPCGRMPSTIAAIAPGGCRRARRRPDETRRVHHAVSCAGNTMRPLACAPPADS